jgi:hypothetical protein
MVTRQASLILDLGGGDRVLAEHSQEMELPEFCESVGAEPLAIYMVGPERDDFEHVLSVVRAGYFRAPHAILVLNHSLVRAGKNAASAFDWLYRHPGFTEMSDVAKTVVMPRLGCMDHMRAAGLSFYDAIDNRSGRDGLPLDPGRQFQVGVWVNKMEKQFHDLGIAEWLP